MVGIGPAKARDLYNAGIKSLEDLVNLDIVSFHEMVLLLVLHDRQNRVEILIMVLSVIPQFIHWMWERL